MARLSAGRNVLGWCRRSEDGSHMSRPSELLDRLVKPGIIIIIPPKNPTKKMTMARV
jgi:hypothetical protein